MRKRILTYILVKIFYFVTKFNNIHLSIPHNFIHIDDNELGDQYNVLLYYYLAFILKD